MKEPKKIAEYCTKHSLHHGCKYPSCSPCIPPTNKSIEDVVEGFLKIANQETGLTGFYIPTNALDFLKKSLTSLVQQSKEELKKDMLIKTKEWHGTGNAIVNDYFNSLNHE